MSDALKAEIAAILQTSIKNFPVRVVRMGLGDECGRCGGSGNFSYNQMSGTRCFGCLGAKQVFPRDLAALKLRACEAVASGKLATYQAEMAAIRTSKDASKRIFAAWAEVDKLNGYGKNWRDAGKPENAEMVRRNDICCEAQARVSAAFNGYRTDGRKVAKVEDPIERLRILNEALAEIEAVRLELVGEG